tara:strand:+ start:756 stop:986 length:231 start_codon:yes stop_codon:yes gene_type:complete
MSLSEKIYEDVDYKETFIYKKDVKEFIKKLKESIKAIPYGHRPHWEGFDWAIEICIDEFEEKAFKEIDKLAGEELI